LKLLPDENLSPRLVNRLKLLLPGLAHVRDFGLKQADDREIWAWAKAHDFRNRHNRSRFCRSVAAFRIASQADSHQRVRIPVAGH